MAALYKLNNENINVNYKETPYLTFKMLDAIPFIRHCFTTREGGVSKGIYSSLNLSFNRADIFEDVCENYRLLCKSAGFNLENIVMSDQIHRTTIVNVTKEVLDELSKNDFTQRKLCDTDGMITNQPNVPLFTYYADCVPLYFVDTVNRAVGLSHSGWRGTAALMGLKTVTAMQEAFGTSPEKLICAIGPSICQECYEVSDDVIDEIQRSFTENGICSREDLDNIYYKKNNGKYRLNLWEANRIILIKAGVKPENIAISGLCTCHYNDELFSHRATNGKRGNLAAVIQII